MGYFLLSKNSKTLKGLVLLPLSPNEDVVTVTAFSVSLTDFLNHLMSSIDRLCLVRKMEEMSTFTLLTFNDCTLT